MEIKEAIAVLGLGRRLTNKESLETAELIVNLGNIMFLASKLAVEKCEKCDFSITSCENSNNVHCVIKELRSAIKRVQL